LFDQIHSKVQAGGYFKTEGKVEIIR